MRITKPKKIYAHSGVRLSTDYPLQKDIDMQLSHLLQIPRIYQQCDWFGTSTTYGFSSLVKRPDGWYLNKPYYIYSGSKPHTYRRLPQSMQYKITLIYIFGHVKTFIQDLRHKIEYRYLVMKSRLYSVKTKLKYVFTYFSEDNRLLRKNRKAFKNLFGGK